MAWPKLRSRKSSGPLVMITERNGLGREGASRISPAPVVTPEAAEATEASGTGPAPWPGLPSQREPVSGAQPVLGAQTGPGPAQWGQPDLGDPQSGTGPSTEASSGASQPGEIHDVTSDPVSFWDWAPADDNDDTRFSLDDEPGAGAGSAVIPGAVMPSGAPAIPVDMSEAGADGGPAFTDAMPPREEGIGHRLGRLDHIFGHSRMGFWRRRVVIAVVIFVLIRVLLNNWQLAVTLAVLAVIADTIIQSRTVTNPLPGVPITRAQRKTLLQLGKLEKAGYKALHARLIPDSEDHIDHLVIGPAGVFSIDSEYWDKHLPIRTKNARQLWHGPFSMKDRLEHARWESERAAELLSAASGTTVSVRPAMAVYGPKIPWDVATIRDVDVFSGGRLRNYLRRYARHNNARPLSATDIDRIYKAAHAAFPHLDPGILAS